MTASNTTDLLMPYTLRLIIDSNTFSTGALSYTLNSANTSENGNTVASILTNISIANGTNTYGLGRGVFTTGTNNIHTYTLNIFFLETGIDQSENQGKSFAAHVEIVGDKSTVPSTDLTSLFMNPGTLIPIFHPDSHDYSVMVENSTINATITATTKDSFSSLKINGQYVASGVSFGLNGLTVGHNLAEIEITDLNNNTGTYNLDIFKQPTTLLQDLIFRDKSKIYSIINGFQSTTFSGTVETITTPGLTVVSTPQDINTLISVFYNSNLVGTGTSVVINPIIVGPSIITIEVKCLAYPTYKSVYNYTVTK